MVNINCKFCKNLFIVVIIINSNNLYEYNNYENRKIWFLINLMRNNLIFYYIKYFFYLGYLVRIIEIK